MQPAAKAEYSFGIVLVWSVGYIPGVIIILTSFQSI